MSPTAIAELREAAAVICDAACGTTRIDRFALRRAHNALARRRLTTTGAVRAAVDAYLDVGSWHQGPFVLRCAIIELARQLGVALSDPLDYVAELLSLFDSPADATALPAARS